MNASGPHPPRFWELLMALALHPEDREAALGDLEEEMRERAAERGAGRGAGVLRLPETEPDPSAGDAPSRSSRAAQARRWYRRQVLRSLWPALRRRMTGRRETRTTKGEVGMMTGRLQDLRFALRTLARHPGFAAAVLLTLGLGIGAAAAVYTVVEGVLLRPLPYEDPDRLRMVYQERDGASFWVSAPNFQDWRASIGGFQDLAAFTPDGVNMVVEGSPVRISSAEVTEGFFRTLGVEPVLGRTFTARESEQVAPVAVVSHRIWQERFGSGRHAVGSTLTLDSRPYEIVGVMPPVRMLPAEADVWIPARLDAPDWRTRRGIGWLLVVGRVSTGVDEETLGAELDGVGANLREAYPESNRDMGIRAFTLEETVVEDVRGPLRVLMAAVLLILVVVLVNVGGLLVARAMTRRREVAIRAALGGGRRRLLAQFLTESLVFAGLGALLGFGVGHLGVNGLLAVAPADMPRLDEVRIGAGSVLFILSASAVAALLFGALPTLHVLRGGHLDGLRAPTGLVGPEGTRLRRILVSAQIALALALVAGSALLLRSFWQLRQVDPGLEAGGVLTAGLPVVESSFASPEERIAYFQSVEEAADALPGVREAALTNTVPFVSHGPTFSYELRDPPADPDADLLARYRVVTPGLFSALGIPFVRGRAFSPEEAAPGGPRAIVVDEVFARDHFADREALGQEVHILDEWWTIVGVVGEIRDRSLRATPERHLYLPLARASRQGMSVVLRTVVDPATLTEPLRQAVRALDPTQPLTDVGPLEERVSASVAQPRFLAWLVGSFAGAALLLASLGVYGVLAYTVARRTREIGVRMALGARRGAVRRLVVRQASGMVAVGIALGLLVAALGAPHLGDLLYQVDPRDPVVLGGVALVLGVVALAAAWLPAARAARLDPSEALRGE